MEVTTLCHIVIDNKFDPNRKHDVFNSKNAAKLILAILMADKRRNFENEKFTFSMKKVRPAKIKLRNITQFMRKQAAKEIFEIIYRKVAEEQVTDLHSKSRVASNLATCIVDNNESMEDEVATKIIQCFENETHTQAHVEVSDEDLDEAQKAQMKGSSRKASKDHKPGKEGKKIPPQIFLKSFCFMF